MWPVVSGVILYALVVAAPLTVSAFQRPANVAPFLIELATRFALLGFTILAMQFVISARIKWIERPFGLDEVYRFHKAMAVFAFMLLAAHPLLLARGSGHWELITTFGQPWPILIGKLALFLMLVLVVVSLFRIALRFEFQKWRLTHNVVAGLVLAIGFTHGFKMSGDLEGILVRGMIGILVVFGALAYVNHAFVAPILARRHAYTVTAVRQETPNVWTLELGPPEGVSVPDYLPGQFHFLTLYRERGLPVEEHPFTISSSPTARGWVASTIKESGDYTSTIGRTKPGDLAAVQGPFGRFSHVLRPGESDLVFISGGIGITPLISMLRYMRDTRADADVQMLCFNKAEKDIAFREEMTAIESGDHPRCRVTHVLSAPGDSWDGETGLADRDNLARLIGGNMGARSYYVCGPAPMMNMAIKALRELGVSASKIYYERFSL